MKPPFPSASPYERDLSLSDTIFVVMCCVYSSRVQRGCRLHRRDISRLLPLTCGLICRHRIGHRENVITCCDGQPEELPGHHC